MFSFRTKLSMLRAILTKDSPFYIQYYINSRCNLMCKQCNIVESNSDVPEATLPEIERIADNLARIGAGVVLLTGGEPFLRRDLPEIIRILVSRGLNVRLQTAGMKVATPEMLRRCVEAGARDINVSLDSLLPAKQDYINGVSGSWESAIRTIAAISQAFPRTGAICSFGCVLSRFNYREIPGILELATRIGWHLSLVPVHITALANPMGFRSFDRSFTFQPEDLPELEAVFARLEQMRRQGFTLFDSTTFLRSSLQFITTGRPTWRKHNVCDSPNLYFAIRPNGDFAVCGDYHLEGEPVNVGASDFPRIFRSSGFRERVRRTTTACRGCHYGSYPEMTIAVRDLSAFLDRIRLNFRAERSGLRPLNSEELFGIVEEIRARDPEVFDMCAASARFDNRLALQWEDPEARRELIREEMLRRRQEGRVRHVVLSAGNGRGT